MKKLTDGLILYHGSYCEVAHPDLKQCAKYKDFGQGFYLTTSKTQAENFSRFSTRKAIANRHIPANQTYGVVSIFSLSLDPALSIQVYEEADIEWLHCVVGYRKKHSFPEVIEAMKDRDILAGKIANDQTNATIAAYIAETFGPLGSSTADEICIRLLLPERLQDQYCFRTNKALRCLHFERSEQICLKQN
ncbi:MAG: DUF3990 domain-containing protein [Lachnospiraceae bacterium]|nr:DUF3990 domain-containing protein [Lachnospiraceae bacterium]